MTGDKLAEVTVKGGKGGKVLWRPSRNVDTGPSQRAVPPWAEKDAQPPPPLSSFYANAPSAVASPATVTSNQKPIRSATGVAMSVQANPNPTHFNRPSPGASPLPVRKSLFRTNLPMRSLSNESLNKPLPWVTKKEEVQPQMDGHITDNLCPMVMTGDSRSRMSQLRGQASSRSTSLPRVGHTPGDSLSSHTPGVGENKSLTSLGGAQTIPTKIQPTQVDDSSGDIGNRESSNMPHPQVSAQVVVKSSHHTEADQLECKDVGHHPPGKMVSANPTMETKASLPDNQPGQGSPTPWRKMRSNTPVEPSPPPEQGSPTPWRKNTKSQDIVAKATPSQLQQQLQQPPWRGSKEDVSATSVPERHSASTEKIQQEGVPWRRGSPKKKVADTNSALNISSASVISESNSTSIKTQVQETSKVSISTSNQEVSKINQIPPESNPTWRNQPKNQTTNQPVLTTVPVAHPTSATVAQSIVTQPNIPATSTTPIAKNVIRAQGLNNNNSEDAIQVSKKHGSPAPTLGKPPSPFSTKGQTPSPIPSTNKPSSPAPITNNSTVIVPVTSKSVPSAPIANKFVSTNKSPSPVPAANKSTSPSSATAVPVTNAAVTKSITNQSSTSISSVNKPISTVLVNESPLTSNTLSKSVSPTFVENKSASLEISVKSPLSQDLDSIESTLPSANKSPSPPHATSAKTSTHVSPSTESKTRSASEVSSNTVLITSASHDKSLDSLISANNLISENSIKENSSNGQSNIHSDIITACINPDPEEARNPEQIPKSPVSLNTRSPTPPLPPKQTAASIVSVPVVPPKPTLTPVNQQVVATTHHTPQPNQEIPLSPTPPLATEPLPPTPPPPPPPQLPTQQSLQSISKIASTSDSSQIEGSNTSEEMTSSVPSIATVHSPMPFPSPPPGIIPIPPPSPSPKTLKSTTPSPSLDRSHSPRGEVNQTVDKLYQQTKSSADSGSPIPLNNHTTTNSLPQQELPPPPPPPLVEDSVPLSAFVKLDQMLPPPPSFTQEQKPQGVPVSLFTDHSDVIDPQNDIPSPEYTRESVTRRIKAFEKQASKDEEPPSVDRPQPVAKPVAPWVKKTSAGPVSQENYWDMTSPEEDPGFPTPPTSAVSDKTVDPSKTRPRPQPQQKEVAPSSSAKGAPIPPPPKVGSPQQTRRAPPLKQRTISTGDYEAQYLPPEGAAGDHRKPVKMPAEGDVPIATTPEEAMTPISNISDDVLFDPWCDPKNPRVINFQDVSAAAFKIKSGIMNTPCTRSHMSTFTDMEIYFKKEFNQYTGSFKERGARYTLLMLSEDQRRKGVIAASAGNHALALSYHGQDLGIPVTVVMPLVAPIMKVQACRQYGANIIVRGNDIGECREIALRMSKEQELLYINGYDHPHILAGQGTMGLEIVEQVKDIDAVVIPVGGGGLIAGVALAVKALYPHVRIIGVESERCASFSEAMKAGRPVYVKAETTLADGLAVPLVGVNAFATASKLVDKVVQVREEWIAISILRLVECEKAVVEGAGATALAAILAGQLPELKGKRIVIPLCGGNIDTTVLGRCLERGLAADGRLVKFTVTVSDRPGGIAELTRLLANLGVSIKDMMHERAWIKNDIFSVEVKVIAETRDHEHFLELKAALESQYTRLRFVNPYKIHDDP